MQPRRSKVVPGPLFYPERTTTMVAAKRWPSPPAASGSTSAPATKPSASSEAPTASTAAMGQRRSGAQRALVLSVAAAPVLPPGATATGGAMEVLSPSLNVYRAGSSGVTLTIAPRTTVLVADHVTNTGAVVRLEQVDYSKAMRAYRVCRQEGGAVAEEPSKGWHASSATPATPLPPPLTSPHGICSSYTTSLNTFSGTASPNDRASYAARDDDTALGHDPAPWRVVFLRLFGATDMVLLTVAVACFLVVVSRVSMIKYGRTDGQSAMSWSSLPWLEVALAALTSGRSVVEEAVAPSGLSPASGEGLAQGVTRGPPGTSSSTAATVISVPGTKGVLFASYTQATSTPALDTSVTLVLLLFSTFLLVKRLSGALSRVYVEEVLVMRGVGLQFSAYGIFNTLRYRHFVDLLMLRSLVIHDAFFRYQPMFFLSSSVENKAERIVYFPDTLPRLAVLRPVLNGIRGVLYGEPEEGPSLGELEERWKKSASEISDGDFFTEDSFAEDTVTTPDDACFSDATDRDED
ncbi:GPI-GlcNAc transferase complex, PIG-H component, putative [Leishmania donovani]|uniref:GPI-GlcNAc transferase complex, PIG-H component, putative n=1 Tax=Leishmania donovani TaxID=5661 RepID=A0A3S5H631_LEIDO|nr:GPI-GlcNAc transferase complex, PIG-H component, putative [Leishmania donovani]